MRARQLPLVLAMVFTGVLQAQTLHPQTQALVDAWLDSEQAYHRLPSMAASLVKGDATVFAKGYGSVSGEPGGRPVTPDTVFSICSISKLFTAIALMQQVEQGRVALDDPLAKHLPEFKLASPDPLAGAVTLRGVLMHAAGLPRETVGDVWTGPDYPFPTRDEMLAGLARQSLYTGPLQRYQYSNLGIALLGEVVARASGQPFERYVMERVVKPMGLTRTSLQLPFAQRGSEMAVGHTAFRRDGTRAKTPAFQLRGIKAAAGFGSTVADLALLARWQQRVLAGSDQTGVLSTASLREMTRIQWMDPDGKTSWGLGFAVTRAGSDLQVSHSGWCPGYRTSYATLPQKELGVAVALGSLDDPGGRARQLLALAQKQPGTGQVDALLAGRYLRDEGDQELIVLPWGAELALLAVPTPSPADSMSVWRAVGPDRFRLVRDDKTLGEELQFLRNAAGQVEAMRIWGVVRWRQP